MLTCLPRSPSICSPDLWESTHAFHSFLRCVTPGVLGVLGAVDVFAVAVLDVPGVLGAWTWLFFADFNGVFGSKSSSKSDDRLHFDEVLGLVAAVKVSASSSTRSMTGISALCSSDFAGEASCIRFSSLNSALSTQCVILCEYDATSKKEV
jgi:hypothetical protein